MMKKTAVKSLFLIEQYLECGAKLGGEPSGSDTRKIVKKYNLTKRNGIYYGDVDEIFSSFQSEYPERTEEFGSYYDLFSFVRELPEVSYRISCGRKKPRYDTGLHVGKWGFFRDDDAGEDMYILADNLNWDFT